MQQKWIIERFKKNELRCRSNFCRVLWQNQQWIKTRTNARTEKMLTYDMHEICKVIRLEVKSIVVWLGWKMMKNGQKFVTNRRTNPNSRSEPMSQRHGMEWKNQEPDVVMQIQRKREIDREGECQPKKEPFGKYLTFNGHISLNRAKKSISSPFEFVVSSLPNIQKEIVHLMSRYHSASTRWKRACIV